jgi:HNH endonuclease
MTRACSVPGCLAPYQSAGYCNAHRKRVRRLGDAMVDQPIKVKTVRVADAASRFRARYHEDDRGCWRWTGARHPEGYGIFRENGRRFLAHRWSYEHHVGPIPDDLQLDHLCRVRACVNPDHLEPVTISGEHHPW